MSAFTQTINSTAAKGYLASLVIHGGAFALCLAASGSMIVPVSLPRYGSPGQRAIELSLGAPAPPSTDLEPPQIDVVISPEYARIGERQFVYVPASEDSTPVAAEVHSQETLSPALPRRQTHESRVEATALSPPAQPRWAARRSAAAMPAIAEIPLPHVPFFFVGRPHRYPAEALAQGWEGTVMLLVQIDADGRVVRVDIETSSGFPAADAEAVNTVRTWRVVSQNPAAPLRATVVRTPVQFKLRY